jgi:formate-dependent nitrite reductase membrane component NrfD
MNEQRLEQIREEARNQRVVPGREVDVAGSPKSRRLGTASPSGSGPGYYGQPVVRSPVWTWEIPIYFFVGGAGGMSALIASAAAAFHQVDLARTSILISVFAVIISPILLTLDLGRPTRFINMLRVFKPQSAMSMGAWILVAYSTCTVPAFIALEIHARGIFPGSTDSLVRIVAGGLLLGSTFFGVLLATYTGVLIGVTVIPVWFAHRILLPVHFGTGGLGCTAALLELLGHRIAPLNAIGFLAAATETILALSLLINKHDAVDRPLRTGSSGRLIQIAEVLAGPLSLLLRAFGLASFAAIAFLSGALLSRFGWISAGKISGRDPEAVFASQRG